MKKIFYTSLFCVFIFACSDIVGVADISNKTITILAPTNEAVINTTLVNFNWDALEDAEVYNLQIAFPNFENAIQIKTDSTLMVTSFSASLDNGNYQWRIRAENSEYQTQYTTQSFIIEE